ncbi:MAG: tetratricopeptide repeat protein [Acidobacteriota bacterium]
MKRLLIVLLLLPMGLMGCAKNPATTEEYEAQTNRAKSYAEAKDYDKAIEAYSKAAAMKPEVDTAYKLRGLTYAEKQDYQQAIQNYYDALDRNQDDAETWNALARASAAIKDYSVAESAFQKAIRLKPDYADPFYYRALMNQERGKRDEASYDLKRCIELSKDVAMQEQARAMLKELGVK